MRCPRDLRVYEYTSILHRSITECAHTFPIYIFYFKIQCILERCARRTQLIEPYRNILFNLSNMKHYRVMSPSEPWQDG